MSVSHSSNLELGRTFSAGKVQITPFLQASMTSFGVLTKNIGAQITGRESVSLKMLGNGMLEISI